MAFWFSQIRLAIHPFLLRPPYRFFVALILIARSDSVISLIDQSLSNLKSWPRVLVETVTEDQSGANYDDISRHRIVSDTQHDKFETFSTFNPSHLAIQFEHRHECHCLSSYRKMNAERRKTYYVFRPCVQRLALP